MSSSPIERFRDAERATIARPRWGSAGFQAVEQKDAAKF